MIKRCPKCGRYMNNYLKQSFGGAILVYTCSCGYSSEESNTGIVMSDKTTTKTTENFYSNIILKQIYKLIKGNEPWARFIMYSDIDGFYVGEDGQLILVDE